MTFSFKGKNVVLQKLTFATVLSMFFAIQSAFANGNFSEVESSNIQLIKLKNPIYLDTSRAKNNAQIKDTSIPYNLRGKFNEADYFTSSSFDMPPPEPIPTLDLNKLPLPSEFKKVNSLTDTSNSIDAVFKPKNDANSFFSPIKETKNTVSEKEFETLCVEKEKQTEITQNQSVQQEQQEPVYSATVNSQESDIDVQGKTISKIIFQGLHTLDSNVIINEISSKEGAFLSTEILQQDLQKIYATGYFSDNMSVEPVLNADNTVDLTFVLQENLIVKGVKIFGNSVVATSELTPFVSQLMGKPQNLKNINASIKNIHNYYHEKGYILADVHSVDDDTEGNLSLSIWEGVINKIDISGNERTKDYIIKRNILTQAGTVYNEEYLKKDLTSVFSTQIFDEVDRTIKPSEEQEGSYDVTIVVKEKSTNSVGFGGGIDSGLGAFGSISIREDNFLGKAQKLSLSGIIGSGILLSDASIKNHMNYQAELSFFEPYFINADNSLMAKLYFREMGSWNVPLAIEQRIGLKAGVEHKVKDYEHLTTSFTAGIEHIDLKEGDFNRISQLYAMHNLNIADRAKQLTGGFFVNLTPGVKYCNVDNIEIPREGIVAQAQFNEAIGVSNLKHTNGKLSGAVTKFFPVFKKSTFSLTGRAGIKVHGDHMPEIMAYRLGGPYSIRGFKMNGVGTGDSFVMGSAELATPLPFVDRVKWDIIKNMRLTFFVDAGKVFDPVASNVLYDRPLHAITAGVGLRLYIPGIGPMSVDYGLPLINPGNYGSENGYFTFGTGGVNGLYGY